MSNQLMTPEELRGRIKELVWSPSGKYAKYVDASVDRLAETFLSQQQAYADAQTAKLQTHLAYMAGEFEGYFGHKNGYLLRNWPEYKELERARQRELSPKPYRARATNK